MNYGDVNPTTGKLYTPTEIMRINSGLDPTGGYPAVASQPINVAPTTAPSYDLPNFDKQYFRWYYSEGPAKRATYLEYQQKAWATYQETGEVPWEVTTPASPTITPYPKINPETGKPFTDEEFANYVTNIAKEAGATIMPSGEFVPAGGPSGAGEGAMPTFGEGAGAGIPTPEVIPAPPYEILPEQQEMMDLLSTTITDWVTSGGYGLPPEIQAQMIQQQTDTLKAREQEAIRVMKNNMERRGITNSGYVQANTNMITSNTSVAIAGAIADVQIKSALMKMASFEKAMGAAAQFLGYLSEQSQLAYAPEFATWQAEQLAKMQAWQGKLDVYKMELNQAYQTQNMRLQAQLTSRLNAEQHQYDLELAEMEIEANQKIAMAQGVGSIFGTILGFLFGK